METRAKFPKGEKLCGSREIAALMATGRRGGCACLRYCCRVRPDGTDSTRILVAVPKRHFKRAVKRNLLKRRIREAYRLQKQILTEGLPEGGTLPRYDILFTYQSDEVASYEQIRQAVAQILQEIRQWNH